MTSDTSQATTTPSIEAEELSQRTAWLGDLRSSLGEVIVGQESLVDSLLVALLTGGHVLLEGVPGLAKSLAVSSVANAVGGSFTRLQFTPDLLPSDLVGTEIYNAKDGSFTVRKGPVFANFVLADEINRAPAKVQSALLEAMQERQVSIGGETHALPMPFLVLATQNPLEQEGTYPLPEAQVDRFMLKVKVDYPTREDEREIIDRMTGTSMGEPQKIISVEQLLRARDVVGQVYLDDRIKDYIVNLVFATRDPATAGAAEMADLIQYGASPRASIYLVHAARAHAFLRHRGYVIPEDVKSVGLDVLRHRVIPSYEAEAEDLSSEDLVRRLFELVEVP
jgi:MoxR-like ATPase